MFSSSAGVRLGDLGFGRPISFDANALSGFSSIFLRRADRTEPGSSFTSLFDIDVILETVRRRFDVLWLHGYYSPTHLMAAATQIVLGRRLLVREEQTLLTTRPIWRRALKKPLLRALFSRSHGLFIGDNNRKWFRYYGMPDERLFHVPFCVDNEFFLAEARRLSGQRPRIREALGVPANEPVILSIARLVPKKQPLVLLEAFRRLRASHRCTLLVVGAGPCEEEMRDFVKQFGIPSVVFAGFLNQSEVSQAYSAADVFALASGWDETWGVVVNEAMNFGLPVVVSDKVGCAADLVAHGENGYVFPHDRPDELARYLSLLVTDPARRESFGRRGKGIIAPWNYAKAAEGLFAAMSLAVGPRRWAEAEAHARLAQGTAPPVDCGHVAQGAPDA
jgi:glycosyltransferase involved in cell wall biosynthesis